MTVIHVYYPMPNYIHILQYVIQISYSLPRNVSPASYCPLSDHV